MLRPAPMGLSTNNRGVRKSSRGMAPFTGGAGKKRGLARHEMPSCCRNHWAVSEGRSPVSSRKRPEGIRNGAASHRLARRRADGRLGASRARANGRRADGSRGRRFSRPGAGNVSGPDLSGTRTGRTRGCDAGGFSRPSPPAGAAVHGGIRAAADRDRETRRRHQGRRRKARARAEALRTVHPVHRVRKQGREIHGEECRGVRHSRPDHHLDQDQSCQGGRDQGEDLRRERERPGRTPARAGARGSARRAPHSGAGVDDHRRGDPGFAQRQSPGPMSAAGRVADSTGNWVDRRAPLWARPYLRLARADRPIGSWLLLLPCWWSAALASDQAGSALPNVRHLVLFAIGTVAMRGAGCTWNDLVDRDLDAKVERTRSRPIPSGDVSVNAARGFLLLQALLGLAVLVQFNGFTIALGIASLAVVAIYPFLKRVTHWPQIGLGLAFSWGALMGWAAAFGRLDWPAPLLYAGSIAWVIGYDTIYAHQDREDDALIGIKSTALLFGTHTKPMLSVCYSLAVAL